MNRMTQLPSASSQPEHPVRDRSPAAPASAPPAVRTVTPRAVGLGLLLVPLLCWWTLKHELIWGGSEFVEASLVVIAVFMLFALVLVNTALRRWEQRGTSARGVVFSQGELLTVY